MIEILKRDLAESDTRFLDEQAAQSEDVRILQERIENQVKFMRKQYKKHIQCIKSTMEQQREFRIVHANESWNTNYNGTMLIESNSLNDRLAMIEKKENNIMKQYEMNEETIRNLKSNINTELHNMQREFDLIKLKCLDNVEKLNYNYQVLKRREEENASAKAAQRRKINKLQDILSNKRKILRETKTEFKAKVPLLHGEIEKLKQDIKRHENKTERFAVIQEKTFKELWDFSQKQITMQLERIFKIDQIIHETQLGIDWHPPDKLKYLDVSELPSFRKKPCTPNAENLRVENDQDAVDSYAEARKRIMMRLIFDATIRNASFIIDNELIDIVKSHPKKNLILLYNAMAAYGLNTMDSWRCLLSYAQSMVKCQVCRTPVLWRKSGVDRQEKVDSERKPESENRLVDNLLVFTEAHKISIEKTLYTTTNNMLDKTRSDYYRPIFKLKSTPLDIHTAADISDYPSLECANTDSDNSTITFSLSLTDFDQLCSENDSNPAIKSQRSFSQVELEHFQMESEEQNDYSEYTSLKGYQNINEEKDFNVQQFLCDNLDHKLVIKDTDYLRVIKKSIDIAKCTALNQQRKNYSDFYLTKTLNIEDISDYWKQFLYAFPDNRLKMWIIFDKAIKKYYQALHLQFKKTKEVEKLENENMELKTILKHFMDAEQNDVRLQNICTPKVQKKQTDSLKNPKTTMITNNSTNMLYGTSVHIFSVNRPVKSNKQTLKNSKEITYF
uniref:Coiled-coil domain-containing protein n=1 Tax=Sipha flava TaxID=143950 RepID=A0A2S2Q9G5_9HEMI